MGRSGRGLDATGSVAAVLSIGVCIPLSPTKQYALQPPPPQASINKSKLHKRHGTGHKPYHMVPMRCILERNNVMAPPKPTAGRV